MASSPFAWVHEAEILRAVAQTVARQWVAALKRSRQNRRKRATPMTDLQSDFGRAFMMLAGYALEVLAKGLIIAKRPNEIQGDQWNKLTSGHDLVALLAETGITLKDPAQKFARRAASAVIWGGRYPVPKRKQADRLIEDFKWGWPSDLDVEMFDAMYRDLVAKFLEEVRRV